MIQPNLLSCFNLMCYLIITVAHTDIPHLIVLLGYCIFYKLKIRPSTSRDYDLLKAQMVVKVYLKYVYLKQRKGTYVVF